MALNGASSAAAGRGRPSSSRGRRGPARRSLLELVACDEETWRPLTGPEALLPGAVDGDGSDVLTSALAGQALAFQATKEAHFEDETARRSADLY